MRIHFGSRSLLFACGLLLALQILTLQAVAAPTTATTVTVTVAGNPVTSVAAGTIVTLTASVETDSAPVSPGLVNFCDATAKYCTDIHILGSAQLTEAGRAVIRFAPGVGSHKYKAVFAGTSKAATSISALSTLLVTGPGVTTTQSFYKDSGSDYTLLANVSNVGGTAPSGTVSFLNANNGDALVGTGSLGASTAGLNFLSFKTPTGSNPVYNPQAVVATGDFNGDGRTDLIVGVLPAGSTELKVMLGNGDGTFTSGQTLILPIAAHIVVADFNSDGKADIAIFSYPKVGIFLGNGDGTFTTGKSLYAGQVIDAAAGDFNGDGIPDLVAVSDDSNQLYTFLGNGDGTFKSGSRPELPGLATAVAVGDFNNDGIPDLAAISHNTFGVRAVTILLGNGNGEFTAEPVSATSSDDLFSLVTGDFNGDGNADLAVGSSSDSVGSVTVLLGTGKGTFNAAPTLPNGFGLGLAIADINGDGVPDLIATNTPAFNAGTALPDVATLWLGKGDGSFTAGPNQPIGLLPDSIAIGDFNGDGRTDLAIHSSGDETLNILVSADEIASATATGIALPAADLPFITANYSGNSAYLASKAGSTMPNPSVVKLSPTTILFESTSTRPVTVTNSGTLSVGLTGFSITGSGSNGYAISDQTCGSSLAAGATCTFDVVFTPPTQVAYGATVLVAVSDDPMALPVILAGQPDGLQVVQINPNSLAFPATSPGDTAGYKTITLTFAGYEPLQINSITIDNTKDFYSWGIREQTCGSTLAPAGGGSCTFRVAFRPTRTGVITADVDVSTGNGTYGATPGHFFITLTGTGK